VTDNTVLVDAHRGSSAWFPENTLVAFEAAIASGADSVEFDVQLTSDGVPIVIHDDTVDRTTDGRGKVSELPYSALGSLDAGSWKSASFSGERVPTLDESLSLLAGMVRINMELKAPDSRLAQVAAAAIEGRGLLHQAMVSSFHLDLLEAVRSRLPAVWIHHFFDREPPDDFWQRDGHVINSVGVSKDHLTREVVEWCRSAGRPVWVWTVDDPDEAVRFAAMGVQSITTNDPVRIMTALAEAGFRELPQFRLG
jgi:glycerophosphoryl diester phosphodiesterase